MACLQLLLIASRRIVARRLLVGGAGRPGARTRPRSRRFSGFRLVPGGHGPCRGSRRTVGAPSATRRCSGRVPLILVRRSHRTLALPAAAAERSEYQDVLPGLILNSELSRGAYMHSESAPGVPDLPKVQADAVWCGGAMVRRSTRNGSVQSQIPRLRATCGPACTGRWLLPPSPSRLPLACALFLRAPAHLIRRLSLSALAASQRYARSCPSPFPNRHSPLLGAPSLK